MEREGLCASWAGKQVASSLLLYGGAAAMVTAIVAATATTPWRLRLRLRFVPPVLHNECSSAPPSNKIPIGISRALIVMSTGRFVSCCLVLLRLVYCCCCCCCCNLLCVAQHWHKRRYNISIALLLAIFCLRIPFHFVPSLVCLSVCLFVSFLSSPFPSLAERERDREQTVSISIITSPLVTLSHDQLIRIFDWAQLKSSCNRPESIRSSSSAFQTVPHVAC